MNDDLVFDKKFEFDNKTTEVFTNMISRSIPNYKTMRDLVFKVARDYVIPKTKIIDIGCSNGLAVEPFISAFGAANTYKLYDISEPMLNACREKYKGLISNGIVDVENHNIKEPLYDINASVILSIFTIQFTPIECRHKIINNIYNALGDGGAFIFVEKVLGNSFETDKLFVNNYYKEKRENAYTQEQIESKRESLEGVLVPLTSDWNYEFLKSTGFKYIDCFWKYLNFQGWIAIKEKNGEQKAKDYWKNL